MNKTFIIGCDVSKNHLDFVILSSGKYLEHFKIENNPRAIKAWIKLLAAKFDVSLKDCVVCMEHTGVYNNHLLNVLVTTKAQVAVESGARIKLSLGLQRGKNDKLDAARIAEYAYRYSDKLRIWEPKRDVIVKLKSLSSLRDRLTKAKVMLEVPLNEAKSFENKEIALAIKAHSKASIQALKDAIAEVKRQIKELIEQDSELKRQADLITSIKGYGDVVAAEIIISTNEFKDFDCPKKFACHAGVAPFEHTSGSSIKGRARVSHRADKNLKQLLHLAAMSSIRCVGKIQDFYQRKVAEGKNKMSVLNAVRNKMIRIVFALIKNNCTYENNYHLHLEKP